MQILKSILILIVLSTSAFAIIDKQTIKSLQSNQTFLAKQKLKEVTLGVDYYPEQWPLEYLDRDMKMIKEDLGADIIRIAEFMWHIIEPQENVFNFTYLDLIYQKAEENGLKIMLGTPTATMPAWLYKQHPDVCTQGPDSAEGFAAAQPGFGGRRQYSFNSEIYLFYSKRIVTKVAERYGRNKVTHSFQIDNELGHENSDLDFSQNSLIAWRKWLANKFNNDINKLNEDWGTVFWSTTYNEFEEIPLPRYTMPGTKLNPNQSWRSNNNPGMLLDFRVFRADSVTNFVNEQIKIVRENSDSLITTNCPGGFFGKALNHQKIYENMDYVAYDNYPVWGGSLIPESPSSVAISLDTMRGLAPTDDNGFMIAEQLIGKQGHDIIGFTPRPKQAVAWSLQALTHGANSIVFFRFRGAAFGQEQFCYGLLDVNQPYTPTRRWDEAKQIYKLARDYQDIWTHNMKAEVAVLYDYDNIYAWQAQPQSTAFDFQTEIHRLYYPFWANGIPIDIIPFNLQKLKNNKYKCLIIPVMFLTNDDLVEYLEKYVQDGGSIWVSYRNDVKDSKSQMRKFPSRLATLAGVKVSEFESLNTPLTTTLLKSYHSQQTIEATVWREGLEIIDTGRTDSVWQYTDDFFGEFKYSAVTQSKDKKLVYIGAGVDPKDLVDLATSTLRALGIRCYPTNNPLVETMIREDSKGQLYVIAINHQNTQNEGPDNNLGHLQPFEVRISKYPG